MTGRPTVDEARMRDGRHRPRLSFEPLGGRGVRGEVRQEDLDGDVAGEPLVARAVDGRHPAGSERREDPVAIRQEVAGHGHGP